MFGNFDENPMLLTQTFHFSSSIPININKFINKIKLIVFFVLKLELEIVCIFCVKVRVRDCVSVKLFVKCRIRTRECVGEGFGIPARAHHPFVWCL